MILHNGLLSSTFTIPRGSPLRLSVSLFKQHRFQLRHFREQSLAAMSSTSSSQRPSQFVRTSGATDSVWVHLDPYSSRPRFRSLVKDQHCDVCVIGAGIAGIQTAYELVRRGKDVVLLEAREALSGETGRTSGHLTNALDDGYIAIAKKDGQEKARMAAESHGWAIRRLEEIAGELNVECEFRRLVAYEISQYSRGDPKHGEELLELKQEAELARELGVEVEFKEDLAAKGWNGKVDQRGGLVWHNQATFHPTRYLQGVLGWLQKQANFSCYTNTRVMSVEEQDERGILGLGSKTEKMVKVQTESGRTIECTNAVEATCVPLQKLSIISEMVYNRTYCIALRVPKGSVEDCLLYDQADAYKYVRLTRCNDSHDYLVVGGCDHKVGQEDPAGRFEELETWARDRFPSVGEVDYRWSGQIYEPVDHVAFIGKNQGCDNIYVVTGDSGDGLTHAALAGRLIADEIDGIDNPWAGLYSPSRLASIAKSIGSMISHDVQINMQYKRFLQSDIRDIEDLVPDSGGVLNPALGKPVAVYKDKNGKVQTFSALCPHMQGVVCWNAAEKSFDCPVHGSRFSKDGVCVEGPAKAHLSPSDEAGKKAQSLATK